MLYVDRASKTADNSNEKLPQTTEALLAIIRNADSEAFDNAMYTWLTQERHKGTPLSGTLVMEKFRINYLQLKTNVRMILG